MISLAPKICIKHFFTTSKSFKSFQKERCPQKISIEASENTPKKNSVDDVYLPFIQFLSYKESRKYKIFKQTIVSIILIKRKLVSFKKYRSLDQCAKIDYFRNPYEICVHTNDQNRWDSKGSSATPAKQPRLSLSTSTVNVCCCHWRRGNYFVCCGVYKGAFRASTSI